MPQIPLVFSPILESLEIAYEDLIKAEIEASLASVMVYWNNRGRPLDLPLIPIANYGDAVPDDIITQVVKSWPYITLEAIEAHPSDLPTERNVSIVELLIRCYTVGTNIRNAAWYSKRYAQALMWIFRYNKPQPIDAGIYEVLALSVAIGETVVLGREALIKRCTIRVPCKMSVRL